MALVSELITEVKADASQFHREMKNVTNSTNTFGSSFKLTQANVIAGITLIGTAIAGLGDIILSQAHAIDDLGHKAEKLGVDFQSFQSLAYAAKLADVELSTLQTSFSRMSRTINEANSGNKTAQQSLAAIGLSARDLINLSVDKQFEKISAAIAGINNVTQQRGSVLNIFGKGGLESIPLITSNIAAARKEFDKFGFGITDSEKKAASSLDEVVKKSRVFLGLLGEKGAAELSTPILKFAEKLKEAWKNSEELRASIGKYITLTISVFSSIAKGVSTILGPVFSFVMSELSLVRQFMIELLSFVQSTAGKVQNYIGHGSFNDASSAKKVDPYLSKSAIDNSASQAYSAASGTAVALGSATSSALFLGSALNIQKIALDSATKSVSDFKKAVDETTSKFTAIRTALDAPGKKQTSDIINNAAGQAAGPIASAEQFTPIFAKALKEANSGDRSNTQSYIDKLQSIIDGQKRGPDLSGGGMPESFNYVNKDVSGLVGALNELKAFLSKETKEQQVSVNIKVAPTKDFVTNITTTQTFKAAVQGEVVGSIAEAARGEA